MKSKFKISRMLLATLLVVSMTACGSKATNNSSPDQKPVEPQPVADSGTKDVPAGENPYEVKEPITIEWWHALESQYDPIVKEMVSNFQAQNPLITVNAIYQGSNNDLNEKLIAANAADALPALTSANTPFVAQYGASGICEILDPYIQADNWDINDFGEGLISSCTYDNKQVSLPFLISTQIMYYNKDIAKAEGITMPNNWNEMDAFLEKATTAEHKATAVPAWDHWYFEPYFLNSGVKIVKDDNTTDIAEQKALDITGKFREWSEKGQLDWLINADDSTNMRQGFFDQKYFSVMHTSSLYNLYLENCKFEVGMWYYPGDITSDSEIGGNVLLIPAKNKQEVKNAAWQFLKFLESADNNVKWATETGYMPTRKSVLESQQGIDFLALKPEFKVIFDKLDNIKPRIQHPGYNTFAKTWREGLGKSIREGADIKTTMEETAKVMDEVLEDSLQ